jgi:hypothetical protein
VLEWVRKENFSARSIWHCRILVDDVCATMRCEYAHPFQGRWVWLSSRDSFQVGGTAQPRADKGGFAGTGNGMDDNGLLEG